MVIESCWKGHDMSAGGRTIILLDGALGVEFAVSRQAPVGVIVCICILALL